jgi:catechol 2,3-dioxygenase-like lactoylglutathione lyase family enzyme
MIKINEIAFIGYPVTDKEKARAFYEGVIGLVPTMNHDMGEGFWVEYEIGTQTLALSNMWKGAKGLGPSIAFEVEDFTQTIDFLRSKDVIFDNEVFETPVCHIGIITDPDGNLITIHKRKPHPHD